MECDGAYLMFDGDDWYVIVQRGPVCCVMALDDVK